MSLKRDDFPATSLSRTTGSRLGVQSSNVASLEAHHPLLSPPRSASPAPYVPYTPRQRVTPTTGTTTVVHHPPSSPHHGTTNTTGNNSGDATSKLQLMHLKAAAQVIGLDSTTLGWSVLEKLVLDPEMGEEWTEVWSAIMSGKATLLLPLETGFTNERITADFMKDHVAFCEGSLLITLSGLRGILQGETLTFRSTFSKPSQQPPLPLPYPEITPISYPQFHLPSHTSSLHLPPRTSLKPPLPPRPSERPHPRAAASSSTSRISNPFASLFGGSKSTPPLPPPPQQQQQVPSAPPSPPASLRSFDSSNTDHSIPVQISAYSIDRRIVRKVVGKEMNKALKAELKAALKVVPTIPDWVLERIHELTQDWYPFVDDARVNSNAAGNSKSTTTTTTTTTIKTKEGTASQRYVVSSIEQDVENVAERLQDFFASVEQDLRLAEKTIVVVEKVSDELEVESDELGREQKEHDVDNDDDDNEDDVMMLQKETRIQEVMEVVERLISWLFYDRLFNQPTTDDASHDEALSNRISALNLLDLSLGHLGIDIGDEVNELDLNVVVKACGEMLTQLDACRCPADKSAILIAAHKIIVDGLSRLPPIRLISEEDNAHANGEDIDDVPETAKPSISTNITVVVESHEAEGSLYPDPSSTVTDTNNNNNMPAPPSDAPTPAESSKPQEVVEAPNLPDSTTPASNAKRKSKPTPISLDIPETTTTGTTTTTTTITSTTTTKPTSTSIISGDVLFPLLIFSIVKSNPPHLISNLLFTQRFRNHQSMRGEESYCLINMLAVVEFLENVDMGALGLGGAAGAGGKGLISTANLTPIQTPRTASNPDGRPPIVLVSALRGRVEQQVDAIAGSANKVISGVVDSSVGILRSFMVPNQHGSMATTTTTTTTGGVVPATVGSSGGRTTPGGGGRTSFGLLRREIGGGGSGFSIASLAASLPSMPMPMGAGRVRAGGSGSGGREEEMVAVVSRPGSIRSRKSRASSSSSRIGVRGFGGEEEEGLSGDDDDDDDEEGSDGDDDEENCEGGGDSTMQGEEKMLSGDARSIRSFESMLSATRERTTRKSPSLSVHQQQHPTRKRLSDRLASVSALVTTGLKSSSSPPGSNRSSILVPQTKTGAGYHSRPESPTPVAIATATATVPTSSAQPVVIQQKLAPPNARFMECTPDDLKLSEVGALLRDYRRLVEGIRAFDGFVGEE